MRSCVCVCGVCGACAHVCCSLLAVALGSVQQWQAEDVPLQIGIMQQLQQESKEAIASSQVTLKDVSCSGKGLEVVYLLYSFLMYVRAAFSIVDTAQAHPDLLCGCCT